MKFLFILLVFTPLLSFASSLTFKLDSKEIKTIKSSKIKSGLIEINKTFVGSVDKTLNNAWRGYERTYRGYNFFEFLTAVYGEDWKNYQRIKFTALDGYTQVASIKNMIEVAKNKIGYISYTETGKKGFSKFYRKEKIVDPGPLYLVWSNFTEKDKATHGDILKWPYQLKTIELISK